MNVICFLTWMGSSAPWTMPQNQNGQPCSLSFSDKSFKACPAWMAPPMKVNPHHNEQTVLLIPQHYRISVVEMEDKHQQYLTAAFDLHCMWAGSERTTRYHVEVLQHFMGWQWMDDMVPRQNVETFHGLAVNRRHDTMLKCCNISFSVSLLQKMP